jgi:hypothetical protein
VRIKAKAEVGRDGVAASVVGVERLDGRTSSGKGEKVASGVPRLTVRLVTVRVP